MDCDNDEEVLIPYFVSDLFNKEEVFFPLNKKDMSCLVFVMLQRHCKRKKD